jgi:hypothetical protein
MYIENPLFDIHAQLYIILNNLRQKSFFYLYYIESINCFAVYLTATSIITSGNAFFKSAGDRAGAVKLIYDFSSFMLILKGEVYEAQVYIIYLHNNIIVSYRRLFKPGQ